MHRRFPWLALLTFVGALFSPSLAFSGPKDVAAARAIGAICLAVATGSYAAKDLAACAPDRVFENLAEPGVREALLP